MKMTIDKIGKEYFSKNESDIIDFQWTNNFGLKVTISTWENVEKQIGIKYEFSRFKGFRLFRIIKGGWKSGEVTQNGILDISRAVDELNEFFISTTNGCLTVLAYEKPTITEIELKYE